MVLTEYLLERIEYINQTCDKVKAVLKYAPEGRLRISRTKGRTQYYHIKKKGDTRGKYIRQNKADIAANLALKDYYEKLLGSASEELSAINQLINFYESFTTMEDVYGTMIPARRNLITPIWLSDEEYAKKWLAQDYERKGFDDDAPEHYTDMNERVRSKSEVLIANRLSAKGAPRIYELPLVINGKTIHPDFTVLNVRTRCVYIWEHLGMMDDPEYFESAIKRLMEYKKAGYYIGVNLIITFETSEHPLNVKEIDAMIENFLL